MSTHSRTSRVLEPSRRLLLTLVAGVLVLLVLGTWWMLRVPPDVSTLRIPGEGNRITVEVLNGTTVNGLARQVTRQLRRWGIDVVYFGSTASPDADSTLVIARRGDTAAAGIVRNALGVGTITDEPSAQLLLDVTVVLGRDAARAVSVRN